MLKYQYLNARSDTYTSRGIARIIVAPHTVDRLHHTKMTVNDYIAQKFQTFGIQLSKADLLEMCLNANVSGEDEMNQDCYVRVSVAIAKFIPSLLLRPVSMGEGGVSISWNVQGVKDYYSFLCSEYNLPNKLGSRIKILDISDYL